MTRTIEERLAGGGNTIPWIPDPAKSEKYDKDCCSANPLIGVAIDHFKRTNFRGDGEYNVVVLSTEEHGDVAVHCQATVLANQMSEARPKYGERVGISYLGDVVGGSGTTYTNYKVVVEREAGGEFNWADDDAPFAPVTPAPVQQQAPPPSSPPQQAVAEDDDIPF